MSILTKFSGLVQGCLFLGALLFLSDCKKMEKPSLFSGENTSLHFTGKTFKMTAATVYPAISGVSDYYSQLQDCQKDDLICFDTANIYTEDPGPLKFNKNETRSGKGRWTWDHNRNALIITVDGSSQTWTVLTNDGTTLKVRYVQTINGIDYTLTATFVKQQATKLI